MRRLTGVGFPSLVAASSFMNQQVNNIHRNITSSSDVEAASFFPTGEVAIELLSELRHLPKRRSVWHGKINERSVLLKIYHPHVKQTRDATAEWENALRLVAAGISAPAPLFRANGENGELIVAFEFIQNGDLMGDSLRGNSDSQYLLDQIFELHAHLHQAGAYQLDNHLGNYLWADGSLYMLDAGSCIFSDAPLTNAERVSNLAMLMANIPLPFVLEAKSALRHYLALLPPEVDHHSLIRDLDVVIPTAVETRRKQYYKKTRRSCTEFEREDSAGEIWLAARDLPAKLKAQLRSSPDQFFRGAGLLKDGNTCTVVEITFGEKQYVLKRYNKKSLGYRLKHAFITPRALRSWTNGHVLNLFGVRTPRPLACYLLKSTFLLERAYLLMEKVSGETLDEIEPERIIAADSRIPSAFARRWQEMHILGATHGDMKASNFIVSEQGYLSFIDLDGMKFDRSESEHLRRREKDMKRFMRNWEAQPKVAATFRKALGCG